MQRYVTPAMVVDLTRTPIVNKNVLMIIRVPGAGAEILVLILQKLQGYNAFKHIRLPRGDEGVLTTLQQVRFMMMNLHDFEIFFVIC